MIFLLPFISLALDESKYEEQANQCICAIIPNQCNPYCNCDPFCTQEQKKEFTFNLPESYSNSKISCDPNNWIKKANIGSIHEQEINGATCYSIEGKEFGKKIKNYEASDFGVNNFNELVNQTSTKVQFKYIEDVDYVTGENLIGIGMNGSSKQYFYIPIGIGSSYSNALLPIRYGISYPNYSSIISNCDRPLNFVLRNFLINDTFSRYGELMINQSVDGFSSFLHSILFDDPRILNIQYIFKIPEDNTNISKISVKKFDSSYKIAEPNFLLFSSEIFFGDTNQNDNTYVVQNMGYYYGVPIICDTREESDPNVMDTNYRKSLQIDGNDILFGCNTSIITNISYTVDNYAGMELFYKKKYNITDVLDGFAGDDKDLEFFNHSVYKLFPNYTHIYKTFGPVIETHFFLDENYTFKEGDNYQLNNDGLDYPIAYWTFFYKKFNNETTPLYLLQKFVPYLIMPNCTGRCSEIETGMIKVIFFELDSDGKLYLEEEERFHDGKLSNTFDLFFDNDEDRLKTIGLFFCFGLLGTIWCWYMCFFYITD